jgi:hypothetical protein
VSDLEEADPTYVQFARAVGLALSPAQVALASVVWDGLEPGALGTVGFGLFGGARTVPDVARRVAVLRLGRASGKTTLCALLLLWRALTADLSSCGPGDEPACVVVAPELAKAQHAIRMALSLADALPDIADMIEQRAARGFVLRRDDGRRVSVIALARSQGGRTLRGFSLVSVFVDESEFTAPSSDGAIVTDTDLIAAAMPRLIRGGQLVLASTPWPAESATARLFEANFGHPETALVARATTLEMRAGDADIAALIEVERRRDPKNAAREYDCELTDGEGLWFEASTIDACTRPTTPQRMPASAGMDLAFRRDTAACVVTERQGAQCVVVTTDVMVPTKAAPLRPSEVVSRFATLAKRHGAHVIGADQHGIDSAREHAAEHSVQVAAGPTGAAGVEALYVYARDRFRQGDVVIPPGPLASQLRGVMWRARGGGGVEIILPRGSGIGHSDLVAAFVQALWQDRAKGPFSRGADVRPFRGPKAFGGLVSRS